MANSLVLTKVDADLGPSAEQWKAQGPCCAAIFIRQGWPPAMSHLSAIEGYALCAPVFSQVARERQGRSNAFLASRSKRCRQARLLDAPRRGLQDGQSVRR